MSPFYMLPLLSCLLSPKIQDTPAQDFITQQNIFLCLMPPCYDFKGSSEHKSSLIFFSALVCAPKVERSEPTESGPRVKPQQGLGNPELRDACGGPTCHICDTTEKLSIYLLPLYPAVEDVTLESNPGLFGVKQQCQPQRHRAAEKSYCSTKC